MLEVAGITKTYPTAAGGLRVLDDVSLTLAPGARLAIVAATTAAAAARAATCGAQEASSRPTRPVSVRTTSGRGRLMAPADHRRAVASFPPAPRPRRHA